MEPVDNVLAPVESIFASLPLGSTPLGRAVLLGGAGGAVAYAARPSFAFFADGTPRNWILTNRNDPEATLFPYWAFVVLPAVIGGIFI